MGCRGAADRRSLRITHHHQPAVGPQIGFARGQPPPLSAAAVTVPPRARARRSDGAADVGDAPDARADAGAGDPADVDPDGNHSRYARFDLRLPHEFGLTWNRRPCLFIEERALARATLF